MSLLVWAAGACRSTPAVEIDPRLAAYREKMVALEEKQVQYAVDLEQMRPPKLVGELVKDSGRGVEPFNSMAYEEVVKRGNVVAPALRDSLAPGNASALLSLLALREIDLELYKATNPHQRVAILIDSLKETRHYNAWGLPHRYWEDAARALIEEGHAVEEPLLSLIEDKSAAPTWGTEGVAEYRRFGYRKCDYAWALLREVRNDKITEMPVDSGERDRCIELVKENSPAQCPAGARVTPSH